MERRSLTTGLHAIPNADPAAVRQFVKQEAPATTRPPAVETHAGPATEALAPTSATATDVVSHAPTRRSSRIAPIGLVPVTVRLQPELAGALKRASLERQLAGAAVYTQQELVEHVLRPWLCANGYLE